MRQQSHTFAFLRVHQRSRYATSGLLEKCDRVSVWEGEVKLVATLHHHFHSSHFLPRPCVPSRTPLSPASCDVGAKTPRWHVDPRHTSQPTSSKPNKCVQMHCAVAEYKVKAVVIFLRNNNVTCGFNKACCWSTGCTLPSAGCESISRFNYIVLPATLTW